MSVDGDDGKPKEGPDSPGSAGWTRPRKMCLFGGSAGPLALEAGGSIGPVEVEYEAYGELGPERDNAVVVCHALTGDAHAAGWDAEPDGPLREYRKRKPGWWDAMIGPGKAIDTSRFYVLCINVLGSCYGSSGPSSVNPSTGRPWGLDFPIVTVGDWARIQAAVMDRLGIGCARAVIGGSMGGQIALELALAFPERVRAIGVLSAGHRLTSQGLAFNAVGRNAIVSDPDFNGGGYYGGERPLKGLAVARMMAQITYLSEESMGHKFGRRLRGKDSPDFTLTGIEFEMESYLNHQAASFVARYDPNSYLYMTRAMDYYDAGIRWGDGDLKRAVERIRAKTLVVSFSSDWLFPPELCRQMVSAMCLARLPVSYVNIPSRYGHDAFLVETQVVDRLIRGFLKDPPAGAGQTSGFNAGGLGEGGPEPESREPGSREPGGAAGTHGEGPGERLPSDENGGSPSGNGGSGRKGAAVLSRDGAGGRLEAPDSRTAREDQTAGKAETGQRDGNGAPDAMAPRQSPDLKPAGNSTSC
ncbi:MAG: homoserine O-acetyltransferase [Deltaproteobacteria bacterium]|jgi:homoserine O-acetyltransferase|nr:homoserine O-acetyltransferase [Deltaproteobacteria bacterium]